MSKKGFDASNKRALLHFAAQKNQREADAARVKAELKLELAQQKAQEQKVQQEKELQLKNDLKEQEEALVARHQEYIGQMDAIHERSIKLGTETQLQLATELMANRKAIHDLTRLVQDLSAAKIGQIQQVDTSNTSSAISTPTAISAPLSMCSDMSIASSMLSTSSRTPGGQAEGASIPPTTSSTPSMSQSVDSIIRNMTVAEQKAADVTTTGDMPLIAPIDID